MQIHRIVLFVASAYNSVIVTRCPIALATKWRTLMPVMYTDVDVYTYVITKRALFLLVEAPQLHSRDVFDHVRIAFAVLQFYNRRKMPQVKTRVTPISEIISLG